MSRKQFIQLHGATCRNWKWSWSFINEEDKIIIFGAWTHFTKGNKCLIFSKSWRIGATGRKQAGYGQSREHIRLIEEAGYELKTFPMIQSDANKNKPGIGPAEIGKIIHELTSKLLKREGNDWFGLDKA